jgi:serine beta-lactamase-like protein LACTB, mitochondrial
VKKRIARGLEIGADATDSGRQGASHAYEFVDGAIRRAPRHDFSYAWGGGGLAATPRALAEWGGRVMSGKVVSRATFERMLVPARLLDGQEVQEDDYTVGFGWRASKDLEGERLAHHSGVTIGARSTLVLWPDRGVAVSLLSNALWVSSIEQSARLLAAPFRPQPRGLFERDCPLGATRYEGQFGQSRIEGAVRFTSKDGVCQGEIDLLRGTSFRMYLDAFIQKDAKTLRIIGLDPRGGLSRAALVTSIGLFDLRAEPNGGHFVRLGSTRTLALQFVDD